jgi:DNA excision repair protein ERCC-4
LTYDPLAFHAYLETLVAASSTSASGGERQHHSPWLMTDAAQVILRGAKRRCYTLASVPGQPAAPSPPPALDDDEEGWAALDEAEGLAPRPAQAKGKGAAPKEKRPRWLPKGMDPVLEELPKWSLLADVLLEIEQEMLRRDAQPRVPGAGANFRYVRFVSPLIA